MVTTSRIREILANAVDSFDGAGVADGDSLGDSGMDSLDRASLFLAIEEELGLKISDDLFEELDTLEAIARHVTESSGAGA
jgi:acyl carrier protein